MNARDLALAMVLVTVWGANFTIIKLGLEGLPPMLLGSLRFALTALPAVFLLRRPAVEARYWIAYGVTMGLGQFGLLFYGMYLGMPAGLASVVLQAQAFFTAVFAVVVLQERLSFATVLGLMVAVIGLYFVSVADAAVPASAVPFWGFAFTLFGAVSWGVSNIVVRLAGNRARAKGESLDFLAFIAWASLIPPFPFLLLSVWLDDQTSVLATLGAMGVQSVLSVAYLAFAATLFGFGVWSALIGRHGAGKVAPVSLLVPVSGLAIAAVFLGEALSMQQALGSGLIIGGMAINLFGSPWIDRWLAGRRESANAR